MPQTTKSDRIAIEDAVFVLKAIVDRAHSNPEFAAHLTRLPVPGGRPIIEHLHAISATATRHPTDWADARRRDAFTA